MVRRMADGGFWRRNGALLAAAAGAVVVGGTGGLLTDIGPWYRGLTKPSWQPPDWLFGPAWTLIFCLMALALARAWNASPDTGARRLVVMAFVVNGALNILWTYLFFHHHRPDQGLFEVVFLWLSIVALIVIAWRRNRTAGLLLVPYLAWVSFAAYLNRVIVLLNPMI